VKQIVCLFDGTWDGPRSATPPPDHDGMGATNVWRLFNLLPGDETETAGPCDQTRRMGDVQVSKYLDGVGDSDNLITHVLGGIFGDGFINRIVRGYTFLSREYAPGDAIHLVGFSRGAYTARALAGMVAQVGLLNPEQYDPGDKATAYRLGFRAWCQARRQTFFASEQPYGFVQRALAAVQAYMAERLPAGALRPCRAIQGVYVWDTVGSLGIPLYVGDQRLDLFRFASADLSPSVRFGYHAMALDEQRADFDVTRWAPRSGVSQFWFPGCHSDVGGGYLDCRLSDLALGWMRDAMVTQGVLAGAAPVGDYRGSVHTPWLAEPWLRLPRAPRRVYDRDRLHPATLERINSNPAYQPAALAGLALVRV
jgi:glutathione S-transferase